MSTFLIFIIILVSNIASLKIGKHLERVQWNELIEKGIIPKPRKK